MEQSAECKAMEAKLRQIFDDGVPFNRVLGLKVASIDPDAPKLRFDMRPELIGNTRRQILHGGVISEFVAFDPERRPFCDAGAL